MKEIITGRLLIQNAENGEEELIDTLREEYTGDAPVSECRIYAMTVKSNAELGTPTQDCMLVQVDGINILCDTGYASQAAGHYEQLVALGAQRIDYLYISHYHPDHAGGLEPMVAAGLDLSGAVFCLPPDVDTTYIGEDTKAYKFNAKVLEIAESVGAAVMYPEEGVKIPLNRHASISFYNTDHTAYYPEEVGGDFDYNDMSMCMVLEHGSRRVFFSSDVGINAQAYLKNVAPRCDIMKTEHHCYNAWHDREFYMKISPDFCFTTDGWGNGGNSMMQVYSHSASQRYLQRNGIPNFCTHDNGTMLFTIRDNVIDHNNKAFVGTVTIEGSPSIAGAIPFDKVGKSPDINLADLILGMSNGSFVCTKIFKTDALWALCSPFVTSGVDNAMLHLYKGGSSSYNGSLSDERNGYFFILPAVGSMTTGIIYGSYVWPKGDGLTISAKLLSPEQYHRFTKSADETKLKEYASSSGASYNGTMVSVDENGYLIPRNACFYDIAITIENKSDTDETFGLYTGSSLRHTIQVPANGTGCMTDVLYPSANQAIKLMDSSGALRTGYAVFVNIKSVNQKQHAFVYTPANAGEAAYDALTTPTQAHPFDGIPYY